jgi:hypothetical protein
MRVFLGLSLTVVGIFALNNAVTRANQQDQKAGSTYKEGLQLSLLAPRHRYKLSEKIKLHVMLTNVSYKSVYVLGSLEWGYNASLLLHIRDSSSKEIEPKAFPDSQIFVDPNDESAFVKLHPNHFVGTTFVSDLKFLNIHKPGKYSVYVEYFSKVPSSSATVKPFWGRENGTLFSNLVWIEVVR